MAKMLCSRKDGLACRARPEVVLRAARAGFGAGNSKGDIAMFQAWMFPSIPACCLLAGHDDADRERGDREGMEEPGECASRSGWKGLRLHQDWNTICRLANT